MMSVLFVSHYQKGDTMVRIKLHRGANQIGGSITEIYTEDTHIFIDFGSELNAKEAESTDNRMIDMIRSAKCDAVLFSHYHGDHVGLLKHIPTQDIRGRKITLGMGKTARSVLRIIHETLSADFIEEREEHQELLGIINDEERWTNFSNKAAIQIGDFTITPVRVDHSAFDAYMFIIEAEGEVIVHTGDFRAHGVLGKNLFSDLEEVLVQRGLKDNVDILITEGTMMARLDEAVMTEEELKDKAVQLMNEPENKYVFLLCSSTNMESLASFCWAAYELNRRMFVSPYVYKQILGYRATAGKENPKFIFPGANRFEPMDRINPKLDGGKTQMEYMKEHGGIILLRRGAADLEKMEFFKDDNPLLIYSMWHGYIDKEKCPDTYEEDLGALVNNFRCEELHTSGHADAPTITKMIKIINPGQGVIPIHTTNKKQFEKLDIGDIKVIFVEDEGEYVV